MFTDLSQINNFISGPDHYLEQVNLTEVLQQAFQQLRRREGFDMIARFEKLPAIQADKEAMVAVFSDLMQTIMSHPPSGSRLFLYVAGEDKGLLQEEEPHKAKAYKINFYTNIFTDDAWKTTCHDTLAECRAVLARYNAGFVVNEIKSTGCLFSISLFGKM